MKQRKLYLVSRNGYFYSPSDQTAQQNWERASWLAPLLPLPCLHEFGRKLRGWFPVWWILSIDGKRKTPMLGYGAALIRREVELVSSWKEGVCPLR